MHSWDHGFKVLKLNARRKLCLFFVPVAFPFIGLAPSIKDVGTALWHCRILQWTLRCRFFQCAQQTCHGIAKELRMRIRADRFWLFSPGGVKYSRAVPQGRQHNIMRIYVCDLVELPPNISGWCRAKPILEYAECHSQTRLAKVERT